MFCPIINSDCKDEKCMFYQSHRCGFLQICDGLNNLSQELNTFNETFASPELGNYLEAIGNIGRDIQIPDEIIVHLRKEE